MHMDLIDDIREIRNILRTQSDIKGQMYYNELSLGPNAFMQIDFLEADHRNVPNGVSLNVPMMKLLSLTAYNDGPGILRWSTNIHIGSNEAAALLQPGENSTVKTPLPTIERVNLWAPSATQACSIRLVGII